MNKTIAAPTSLLTAMRYFSDPDVCLSFLAGLRWPDGVTCPRCGSDKNSFLSTRRIWKCKGCGKQFSVKLGTIFEDSPIGLDKWLPAIWLLVNCQERNQFLRAAPCPWRHSENRVVHAPPYPAGDADPHL